MKFQRQDNVLHFLCFLCYVFWGCMTLDIGSEFGYPQFRTGRRCCGKVFRMNGKYKVLSMCCFAKTLHT
jgi:hypothetical protein